MALVVLDVESRSLGGDKSRESLSLTLGKPKPVGIGEIRKDT